MKFRTLSTPVVSLAWFSALAVPSGLITAFTEPEKKKCGVNMVPVGPVCMDQYEASVWSQPPTKSGDS